MCIYIQKVHSNVCCQLGSKVSELNLGYDLSDILTTDELRNKLFEIVS